MKLLMAMNEREYSIYIKDKIDRYAVTIKENTFEVTDISPFDRAEIAISGYLPNGFHTKNHEFYNIFASGNIVGNVWIKVDEESKSAFLYEIYLKKLYRSNGIGKKVMTELESHLSSRNIVYFKLHVFGNNEHAINLYNNLGFHVAGINMFKEITGL